MRYERDLQVKLQERYRRLYKTDYTVFDREIKYFYDFIQQSAALRAIIERVASSLPELDADKWIEENFTRRGYYDWPDSEIGRTKVAWRFITRWAGGEDPQNHARCFSTDTNFNAMIRDLTEKTVEPFVEYLQEQIGSASEILYMLERFARRLEWFDQAELFDKYEADTKHGEDLYDQYLRKFLFDQGIDYPFSQPKSASGQADIVSGLEGDDPLVCEVKLYSPEKSYDVGYVAQGFQQAVSYAHNYGKNVAYLVVFNLSDQGLQLPTDEDTKPWPPRLHVEGVTVYIVTVHAKPRPSASKRGKSSPRVVRRDELVRQTGT
ncbi:hypothetical protein [Streptomyces sp. NL15-2K]|uniref:hypothetical protein n=1 Tax=Streptomyces sp. NL15-2K TaxID=376149 RepID=UPI000F57B7C7|nr:MULTISPECIES: hypothetical protein [Actinomycetes]WKX09986.1 hypothetical protein Q4V64_21825 [Kutzneria buriramensis]